MDSFNDYEKRWVLGEMLKVSDMDVGLLIEFVKSQGIEPNWGQMLLPRGRNVDQCYYAAENMLNTRFPAPVFSPLKRKSVGELSEYASTKRRAIESPGELSPRGFPLPGASLQSPGGPQGTMPPRPNGYAPMPVAPSPTVSAYNPSAPPRKRGRPPKTAQPAWQVTTGPKTIAPSPAPPATAPTSQPHSPGLMHLPHPTSAYPLPDLKSRKKALPEIAPRPAQGTPGGGDPAVRSPALPGEYQSWRDETSRRDYYHIQSGEPAAARDRPYAPILPRPMSPYPPRREAPRPRSTEPRDFREAPPPATQGAARAEGKASEVESAKTQN